MVPRWQHREKKSIACGRDSFALSFSTSTTLYNSYVRKHWLSFEFHTKVNDFPTYFCPFIKRISLKKRFWYGDPPIKIKLFCHFWSQLICVWKKKFGVKTPPCTSSRQIKNELVHLFTDASKRGVFLSSLEMVADGALLSFSGTETHHITPGES